MNPLAHKRVEQALVDELRLCADGAAPTKSFLRQAIDCSPAELAGAVQSLRYQGKMLWDRLALSPSMLAGEEPANETAVAPIAAEGGAASACATPPSLGPDDHDDDDYPGEVNDEAVEGPQGNGALPPEGAPGHGADVLRSEQPALPQRRVEEPRAEPTNDQPARTGQCGEAAPSGAAAGEAVSRVPGGWHKASRAAGARPQPAPAHEPEIARMVREETNDIGQRRRLARSTSTVRQPLEIRKFGIPDLNVSEAIGCMLSEEPRDILLAVSRKHPEMWRRCVLLARERGEQPIQTLYTALTAGLAELEPLAGKAQAYGG